MPKVSLLRPDGSSLTDIYSSKREDMWAKIMKAQLAEEEEQKARDRQAKLKAHEDFGAKLKQQVGWLLLLLLYHLLFFVFTADALVMVGIGV